MNSDFEFSNVATLQIKNFEDNEQNIKLLDCLRLLLSAGYFRVKIEGLNAFDKIVGGMVWCISLCAQSVDVDLLYSENSTIGKKIALTEKIVEVLPKLNCPYLLEPHQIQGLDSFHILPIIQWLVEKAKEVKAKRGDEYNNFAVYQFTQKNKKFEDNSPDFDVCPVLKCRKVYKRTVQMKSIFDSFNKKQLFSTVKNNNDVDKYEKKTKFLIICQDGNHKTALNSNKENETNVLNTTKTLDCLKNQLKTLDEEELIINNKIIEKEKEYKILNSEKKIEQEFINNCNDTFPKVDIKLIETFKKLLEERDNLKKKESLFKKECRNQIEELNAEIEKYKNQSITKTTENNLKKTNVEFNEKEILFLSNLNFLTNKLAQKNKEIFNLKQEIEKHPSQLELNQYQRRFIELCNLMLNKHNETKRFYTSYNTLIDSQNFLKREIDLLNSINDLKHLTLQKDYKDSFVENLKNICQSVDQSLDKILCGKQLLQNQRDGLFDNLQLLINKRRYYMKTVSEFQTECQKTEKYRMLLEKQSKLET